MTAMKRGDRVHIEFDGTIWKPYPDDNQMWLIRLDGMGGHDYDATHGTYPSVYPEHCTVIVPPIKVGDEVTVHNIGQLPELSIVARPGYFPRTREANGMWSVPGGDPCTDRYMTLDNALPIVLRVGES